MTESQLKPRSEPFPSCHSDSHHHHLYPILSWGDPCYKLCPPKSQRIQSLYQVSFKKEIEHTQSHFPPKLPSRVIHPQFPQWSSHFIDCPSITWLIFLGVKIKNSGSGSEIKPSVFKSWLSGVTLGKSPNLSMPLLCSLVNEDNCSIYFTGCCEN